MRSLFFPMHGFIKYSILTSKQGKKDSVHWLKTKARVLYLFVYVKLRTKQVCESFCVPSLPRKGCLKSSIKDTISSSFLVSMLIKSSILTSKVVHSTCLCEAKLRILLLSLLLKSKILTSHSWFEYVKLRLVSIPSLRF